MSIFGKQPDTLTLENYTVILPNDNPSNGDVMHIASIDATNHIIYFEWSEKTTTSETVFENAKVKIKLEMGDGTFSAVNAPPDKGGIINILDNKAEALNITEGNNTYLMFITTDGSEQIKFNKNSTFNGTTIADLGTVTTANIDGGTIDGTVIGGASAEAGTFAAIVGTSLDVSDGNITNVGSIACDSIGVDDASAGLIIDFGAVTGKNKISLTDNLADALNITEGSNSYLKFVTTNGSEQIISEKSVKFENSVSADIGLSVKNGSTTAGFIDFYEDSDNGTNKTKLIGQASLGSDITITLPSTTGTLAIACFDISTLVTMSDDSTKTYGALEIGDQVKSISIENLISSDNPNEYLNQEITSINGTFTTSTVTYVNYQTISEYFIINNSIKVTAEHPLFVKRDGVWKYRRVWTIQQNDKLYTVNQSELNVDSIVTVKDSWLDVCTIGVENIDNYFAGEILAHNK